MDLILSGGEESLLSSLDFSLPPTTNYIQSRRLVSYYPTGASTFSPTGVRVCRFNLNGAHWLDPASIRIYAKLTSTSTTTTLQLADGPHCLLQRVRCFIGGTLIEDSDHYGRTHHLSRRILMSNSWKTTMLSNADCRVAILPQEASRSNSSPPGSMLAFR